MSPNRTALVRAVIAILVVLTLGIGQSWISGQAFQFVPVFGAIGAVIFIAAWKILKP